MSRRPVNSPPLAAFVGAALLGLLPAGWGVARWVAAAEEDRRQESLRTARIERAATRLQAGDPAAAWRRSAASANAEQSAALAFLKQQTAATTEAERVELEEIATGRRQVEGLAPRLEILAADMPDMGAGDPSALEDEAVRRLGLDEATAWLDFKTEWEKLTSELGGPMPKDRLDLLKTQAADLDTRVRAASIPAADDWHAAKAAELAAWAGGPTTPEP